MLILTRLKHLTLRYDTLKKLKCETCVGNLYVILNKVNAGKCPFSLGTKNRDVLTS